MQPKVSVIIPTYKRPGMLGRAIDSVLAQTYTNYEIIIVDDNNENTSERLETEAFMAQYASNDKIIYLKHAYNKNGAAARNTGINYSNANYIAFLDDDDEFLPQKLELQVRELESLSPEYGAVYCNYSKYKESKKLFTTQNKISGNLQYEILSMSNDFGPNSTLLFKKSVLVKMNGFDESFRRHQDWELLVRFFRNFKIGVVSQVLLVMHSDCNLNRSDPQIFLEAKAKYLNQYKNDIHGYSTVKQQAIYNAHNYGMVRQYLTARDFHKARFFYGKLKGIQLKRRFHFWIRFILFRIKKHNTEQI